MQDRPNPTCPACPASQDNRDRQDEWDCRDKRDNGNHGLFRDKRDKWDSRDKQDTPDSRDKQDNNKRESMAVKQGQGKGTARKERGFDAIFGVCLDISKGGAAAGYPYWHIDMNSGCGWNAEVDCPGSPIVFVRRAVAKGRRFNAMFCDLKAEHISQLRHHLAGEDIPQDCRIELMAGDNRSALAALASRIEAAERRPERAVGTLLCDPNGEKGMPIDEIIRFAGRHERIDLIVNLNVNLFFSYEGLRRKGNEAFACKPTLPEVIDMLRPVKSNWIIRNPPAGGRGHRFTILFGSNFDRGKGRFADFYPLDSLAGTSIVTQAKRQNASQKILFPEMEG